MTKARIDARFAALKAEGRAGFVAYVMAGDPDADTALKILQGLPAAGADFIELGFPFSDPMAEGPPIQRAAQRALAKGMTLRGTLDLARAFRERDTTTPLILMGYTNPLVTWGYKAFALDAAEAGIDGLIVVDLPPEESDPLADALDAAGVSLIRLATPTSDDKRLATVVRRTSGFVYYVSVAGVTGVKEADAAEVAPNVARVRAASGLPVAVGFGIKTPERAAAVARVADAVVVGSALVDEVAAAVERNEDVTRRVLSKAESLAKSVALRAAEPNDDGLEPMAMAEQRNDKPGRSQGQTQRRGWLSRIAPGVRNAFAKRETPENLWVKCPDTGEMIYRPDLEAALFVTPSGHHMRIGAKARLDYTFDEGKYERIASPVSVDDPLKFPDIKPYPERLKAARKTSGEQDAMAIGYGHIHGQPAVVAVQDFAFMGGSLGVAVGEAFVKAAQEAVKRQVPFVIFTASGGARMQEGTLSLMQMARTTLALNEVKSAGLPYVVVLTDPTTGGVMASYAMLGDIHLAEPNALIGFAGRRVIEQTIRETLPAGFQRAEFLVERGVVDQVVTRKDLPQVLGSILKTLMMGRERLPTAA